MLKLAQAVLEARAYDCPPRTTEKRWRQVVTSLKGKDNSSKLFKDMVACEGNSTSWRRVQQHFAKEFKLWEQEERTEANTSGAQGTFNDLDRVYTTIQREKASGLGQVRSPSAKKKKPSRSSFGRATRAELQEVLKNATGAAKKATKRMMDQVDEGSDSDQGEDRNGAMFKPKKKPSKTPPDSKTTRGRGTSSKAALASQMNSMSEIALEKVKLEAEAKQRAHQLELRRLELEERREEREAKREERDLKREELEAKRTEMMLKFMEKFIQQ